MSRILVYREYGASVDVLDRVLWDIAQKRPTAMIIAVEDAVICRRARMLGVGLASVCFHIRAHWSEDERWRESDDVEIALLRVMVELPCDLAVIVGNNRLDAGDPAAIANGCGVMDDRWTMWLQQWTRDGQMGGAATSIRHPEDGRRSSFETWRVVVDVEYADGVVLKWTRIAP
jgi:hypothetical protein